MLYNILLIVQIVVSVGIIVLVLMQQGKGADAGAAFGSGASGTVFGARGAANFLSRTTAILATVFFLNSGALAFLASGRPVASVSIMDSATQTAPAKSEAPAAPSSDVPPVPGAGTAAAGDVPQQAPAADAAPSSDVPPAPAAEKLATPDAGKPVGKAEDAKAAAKPEKAAAATGGKLAGSEKAVQEKK